MFHIYHIHLSQLKCIVSIVLSQLYFVRLDEHFVVMIICIILIQYNIIPTEEFFIFEFIPYTFLISIIEILKIDQTNCYVHIVN